MRQVVVSILVLGLLGFCFGILLGFLSKKFKVKVNSKVKELVDALPGANCGACGFSSCQAFAEAIANNHKIFSGCILGGKLVDDKILKILGLSNLVPANKKVVVCHCGAKEGEKKFSNKYEGPAGCRAVDIMPYAGIDCLYGCFGLGDCVKVCPVGAITIREKKVEVDIDKCIGCGKCAEACPRNLFELVTVGQDKPIFYVSCSNKDKGVDVNKVCSRGCIGCGICVQLIDSPYILNNNLSRINRKKMASPEVLKEAQNKCPTKCIVHISSS